VRFKLPQVTPIKTKKYDDGREMGMDYVCRCDFCKELFNGIKYDTICGDCDSKPEIENENEDNTEIVNKALEDNTK